MGRSSSFIRRILRLPGVPEARHVAERAVAPYLRADLVSLHETILEHNHRLRHVEDRVNGAADVIDDVQRHMPAVLNAIASVNGTARLLRRELDEVSGELKATGARLDASVATSATDLGEHTTALRERADGLQRELWSLAERLDAATEQVRSEMRPHIGTIAWLLERVETVRAEAMHEIRYGRAPDRVANEPTEIVNPDALAPADGAVRFNIGCGHLPIPGFVNVDMRKLPGVDVVAPVDRLPAEPGSVTEIFSAHVLEHFPEEQLRRTLLPYWFSLLRAGGVFRFVVPDLDAMITQYRDGEIDFAALRAVAYGGQEYEGDFHFTAFTPDSMSALLAEAGFDEIELVERARVNGDCLELEMVARRPS
jgi:hypothetical protein